jgi:hypothetical protein
VADEPLTSQKFVLSPMVECRAGASQAYPTNRRGMSRTVASVRVGATLPYGNINGQLWARRGQGGGRVPSIVPLMR